MKQTYVRFGLVVTALSSWLTVAPVAQTSTQGKPQGTSQDKSQGSSQSKPQTPSQGKPQGTTGTTTMTVKAGDIAGNPDRYYGQKVTVRAEAEDVLGRQVFLLDEDKLFTWPDVLVITPQLSSMVPEDEMVTVTGTVRSFVEADFRRDYDWDWWGDMDTDIVVAFRNRPVIVADSVKTENGTELVQQKKQ